MDLKHYKILKKCGEILGRKGIAEAAIELCKEVVEKYNYIEAIKALGKFHALALACKFDFYSEEKSSAGFYDQLEEAELLIKKLKKEKPNV